MEKLYRKKKDLGKVIVGEFFIISSLLAIINWIVDIEILFLLIIIPVGLGIIYFVAAIGIQELCFYSNKLELVRPLFLDKIMVEYQQIERVVISHVYREGTQLFIHLKTPIKGKNKIQFDFNRNKDKPIIQIFTDHNIEVMMK